MNTILNWIVKGLIQWLYGLTWQAGEFIMNALMDVFNMDMDYFNSAVPVSETIMNIMFGVGWALLLGNLVFQAAKSMMSGIGFEGEDPATLGTRTMVFAFLLVCSRQICELGLGLGATVVDLLQVPGSVILPTLTEDMFGIDASWLLMMIVGIIILFQLVKFFFEVGERYVIVGVLTILSPLAFAMGGSKNTMDIFKGWARMYGSMCLMLVMNVVFMKLLVSAMAVFPHGLAVFPWLILIIALARVARKIDSIIARIGLNPAITGDGLGRGLPGMMALMVGRNIASGIIGSKFNAGKAAMGAAKSAVSGASAHALGFTGGTRPAPSPINTGTTSNTLSTIATASAMASPVSAAANTFGGTKSPVNPPVGRTSAAQRNKPNRSFGAQPSSVYNAAGNVGSTRKTGIPVTADDMPAYKTTSDLSKPPQAPRMNTVAPVQPMDIGKNAGTPVQQGTGAKPSLSTPIKQTQNENSTKPSGANVSERSNSVRNSGVSPVHTSHTPTAQTPINASPSQGGAQARSHAQTTQQGAQVQTSIHQNTQNLTSGGSVTPSPVQTQAIGSNAVSTPAISQQHTASAPTPTVTATAAQSGNPSPKAQTSKAKVASGTSTQKEKTPKPIDLRSQGKTAKLKQDKTKNTPKRAGKNKAPSPVDINSKGGDKR